MHLYQKRLNKEFKRANQVELHNIEFLKEELDLTTFKYRLRFQNHQVYQNNSYKLNITITKNYPVDSPIVTFQESIPVHPHIYSNGHICLNLLGDDWTPACSVESIVLSIQSMLENNQLSELPPDNDNYVKLGIKNPKNTSFVYHDDNV